MTDEIDAQRAVVSVEEQFRRRLPPGWEVMRWQMILRVNDRVLDIVLRHRPSGTEFGLRCTEMPDINWLVEELRLAEHCQQGVEISVAHGEVVVVTDLIVREALKSSLPPGWSVQSYGGEPNVRLDVVLEFRSGERVLTTVQLTFRGEPDWAWLMTYLRVVERMPRTMMVWAEPRGASWT